MLWRPAQVVVYKLLVVKLFVFQFWGAGGRGNRKRRVNGQPVFIVKFFRRVHNIAVVGHGRECVAWAGRGERHGFFRRHCCCAGSEQPVAG